MSDNITLPREVVEKAIKAFENGCPPTCEKGMVDSGGFHPWGQPALVPCPACLAFEHLRTALAAEQPKPEPVASDDDEEFTREDVTTLLLEVMDWVYAKAHRNRPMTEAEQKVLDDIRTALAAEPTKPEPVAWRPRLSPNLCFHWSRPWNEGVPSEQTVDYWNQKGAGVEYAYAAPPATHPGYVIGSHWLETAYSRICTGEAEADVLRDCGWERVDDIEALRRDAERYRYLRDKAYVWDSDMPKAMRPVALWLHADGNANIDAAIDAAMGDKR